MSYLPQLCAAGSEPNPEKSDCLQCGNNFFNPVEGGKCIKCPAHTHSNMNHTACIPFDIIEEKGGRFPIHQLVRPDLFCLKTTNKGICDYESNQIGPIK